MSESKKPRPLAELTQEYQNLCFKAGQVEYQLFVLQKDLDVLNEAIRDINFEANAAKQLEAEAQKQAEGAKSNG